MIALASRRRVDRQSRSRVLWSALWPTLSAALAMAAAVKVLQAMRPVDSAVFGLLRDVAAGAIVYIAATAVLWFLRGRPDGLEREVYRRVERILAGRESSSKE